MSKSPTITDPEQLPNPTPGEILLEEFLRPMDLSQTALAVAVRVPPRRINEIVLGKRAVTADTDLRLTRYFGLTPGFFLGLQADHDLMARRRELGPDLEAIKPRAADLPALSQPLFRENELRQPRLLERRADMRDALLRVGQGGRFLRVLLGFEHDPSGIARKLFEDRRVVDHAVARHGIDAELLAHA